MRERFFTPVCMCMLQTFPFHIPSRWVKVRLHAEFQFPRLPRSYLKVPVVGVNWLEQILPELCVAQAAVTERWP